MNPGLPEKKPERLPVGRRRDEPQIAYEPDLIPPLDLMRQEGVEVLEDWFAWASEWSMLLRVYGGMSSTSSVLEIGCGLGRIAFALAVFCHEMARTPASRSCRKRSDSSNRHSSGRIRTLTSHGQTFTTRITIRQVERPRPSTGFHTRMPRST